MTVTPGELVCGGLVAPGAAVPPGVIGAGVVGGRVLGRGTLVTGALVGCLGGTPITFFVGAPVGSMVGMGVMPGERVGAQEASPLFLDLDLALLQDFWLLLFLLLDLLLGAWVCSKNSS